MVFARLDQGRNALVVQAADGTSTPKELLPTGGFPSSWTPDGRQLAITRADDIYIVTMDGEQAAARALAETPHAERWPEFSPDGRWLAFGSNVSGRFEVYVRPYPGPGPAEQVSIDGGQSPAWNPSGGELFFLSLPAAPGRHSMMAADFAAGPSVRIGRPRPLFGFDPTSLAFVCMPNRCFDVSADGQRFYAMRPVAADQRPPVTHINLIQNWFEELKAKVPVR